MRGRYHALRRDWPRATDRYARAVARHDGNARWHFRLGIARESIGDRAGAYDSFRSLLRIDPRLRTLTLKQAGSVCRFMKQAIRKRWLPEAGDVVAEAGGPSYA